MSVNAERLCHPTHHPDYPVWWGLADLLSMHSWLMMGVLLALHLLIILSSWQVVQFTMGVTSTPKYVYCSANYVMKYLAVQAKVSVPSEKQAKKLPAGVKMTSPIAQVLAGGYRKAREVKAPSLDTVAATLAAAINVRSVMC